MNEEFKGLEGVELEEVSLEEIAEKAVDRKKYKYLSLDKLIEGCPDGVTVNGCFTTRLKNGDCMCATFEEDPEKYFPAKSGDLGKIFSAYIEHCGGDETKLNQRLNEKPVKIKIYKVQKKNGGLYVCADVVRKAKK